MSRQLTLDFKAAPPLSHRDDPKTSYEAGDKMIKSGKLNRQEAAVYRIICWWYFFQRTREFTAKELNKWWGDTECGDYFTVQRRLSGLHRKVKIERTGEKRDGCCVWRLV